MTSSSRTESVISPFPLRAKTKIRSLPSRIASVSRSPSCSIANTKFTISRPVDRLKFRLLNVKESVSKLFSPPLKLFASKSVIVSFPIDVFCTSPSTKISRSNVSPAPLASLLVSISSPAPPMRTSLPRPPISVSFPPNPSITSSPCRPSIISSAEVPDKRSFKLDVDISLAPCESRN